MIKFLLIKLAIFFEIHSLKQPLRGMELQEKEAQKDFSIG